MDSLGECCKHWSKLPPSVRTGCCDTPQTHGTACRRSGCPRGGPRCRANALARDGQLGQIT
eukprot:10843056-Alexandrium_andersonii.AAC.1